MSHVYVAIGSNINPEENIAKAAGELQRLFPDARFSSWYRNRAVGFEGTIVEAELASSTPGALE